MEKYKGKTPSKEHDYPEYAAMIQSLDENVGRVLNALDRWGEAEAQNLKRP